MTNSYKLRPRPNLFDLSIMEGFLNGGGEIEPVERVAYWVDPRENDIETCLPLEYAEQLDD